MFGILRFILSLMVVVSHTGLVQGFHLGVFGVISFFILSGYVTAHLYASNYVGRPGLFLIDRFFRIYPLYLFWLSAAVLFAVVTNYADPHFTFWRILNHILIAPLNMNAWIDKSYLFVFQNPENLLLPPLWYLASEIQFYLLVPIFMAKKYWLYVLTVLSLAAFSVAIFDYLPREDYTYRLIVGTLFMFCYGILMYRSHVYENDWDRYMLWGVWSVVLGLLVGSSFSDVIKERFTLEVLAGFLIGVPVVKLLSLAPRQALDEKLGQLAYPIFLNHFLFIFLIDFWQRTFGYQFSAQQKAVWEISLSLVAAAMSVLLIETPARKLRKLVVRKLTPLG